MLVLRFISVFYTDGVIHFGITPEEFEIQKKKFTIEQQDSLDGYLGTFIYGILITNILGEFTPDNRLRSVTFLSSISKENEPKTIPFEDFLTAKFGSKISRGNTWIVGNRRFYITTEEHMEDRSVKLSRLYRQAMSMPLSEFDKLKSDDPFYNYYVMRVVSDSLLLKIEPASEEPDANEMNDKAERESLHRENQLKKL